MKKRLSSKLMRPLRLSLLAPLLLSVAATASDTQSWLDNSLTLGISDDWSLKVTQELRSNDLDYGDRFLRNWSLGVARNLPRNTYLGASYKREWEEKAGFTRKENRLTLEGGWKKSLAGGAGFDARLRSEFRRFESDRGTDNTRYRIRVRLRRKIEMGRRQLTPFVWSELFSNPDALEFERVRSALGASVRLDEKTAVQIGYVRQDTRDASSIQALKIGFDLSF